ncbi:lytic transglycosylase domain-containing protein [bacterium]|nr:lytic transglycosylase domain-containing protein [bacterium]MCI0607111.1 lytic transglycosylase domain-containing protein [bacterium]
MSRSSLVICVFLLACPAFSQAEGESEVVSALPQIDLELLRPAGVAKPGPAPTDFLPERYASMVLGAAVKHGVSWQLVGALIKAESNFKSKVTSHRGARGLMQLTPRTASRYRVAPSELYDPYKNIEAGVKHLKMLIERYSGDLELAIAAYNTGEYAVDRYRGIPPFRTTRQFVRKVLSQYLAWL